MATLHQKPSRLIFRIKTNLLVTEYLVENDGAFLDLLVLLDSRIDTLWWTFADSQWATAMTTSSGDVRYDVHDLGKVSLQTSSLPGVAAVIASPFAVGRVIKFVPVAVELAEERNHDDFYEQDIRDAFSRAKRMMRMGIYGRCLFPHNGCRK